MGAMSPILCDDSDAYRTKRSRGRVYVQTTHAVQDDELLNQIYGYLTSGNRFLSLGERHSTNITVQLALKQCFSRR
jgi:hypothetical protein